MVGFFCPWLLCYNYGLAFFLSFFFFNNFYERLKKPHERLFLTFLTDKIAFHPVHKHIVQSICVNVVELDG